MKPHSVHPHTRSSRHAFVLLSVLLVLAIAVVLAGSFASRSMSISLEAARQRDACQRRWARVSLVGHVLPRVLQVPHDSPSEVVRLSLGGLESEIEFADEQAKLRPGYLRSLLGRTRASQLIRSVSGDRFSEWEAAEEFGFDAWAVLLESPAYDWERVRSQSREVTFWGDGRIRFRAAADETIRIVLNEYIGPQQASEFVSQSKLTSLPSLDSILRSLDWRASELDKLGRILTDETSAVSAWMQFDEAHEFHVLSRAQNGRFYTDSVAP